MMKNWVMGNDRRYGNWNFSDSDFVLGLINRQFYLEYHRDFTHSLLLIPFYSLFFSWLFVKLSKRPHFWGFYKICLLALVSHVLLDLLTSYGTMVFSPFFEHRYAWDLVFIIDLIFSGIVILPLIVSLFRKKKSALDLPRIVDRTRPLHPFLLGPAQPGHRDCRRLCQNGK